MSESPPFYNLGAFARIVNVSFGSQWGRIIFGPTLLEFGQTASVGVSAPGFPGVNLCTFTGGETEVVAKYAPFFSTNFIVTQANLSNKIVSQPSGLAFIGFGLQVSNDQGIFFFSLASLGAKPFTLSVTGGGSAQPASASVGCIVKNTMKQGANMFNLNTNNSVAIPALPGAVTIDPNALSVS